ncbi:energy-coupling factor transporter transmembrane component T [Nocardioides bizhenqiangii]|uniref:Energy-coupling factor transporter transmembrane component T n=1 Tax=Nocardioides bizhenqiangii TaxID=3095076 RepID=A0ABZ0ZVR9_9ACTN|nr:MULTISPECIES: energy-coupling factor transporter transmembrane component T [unclassified Nocardioides]MDZ5622946.1 energy-coupling factor transporter transmembrane component T [Nocardioides sp. HM23]WQQ27929.1 energy-coupling factor transporter transmembrane component T [Nocardioides sp. HM61]
MRLPRDLHPVAWWCWAVGLAVGASCTTNPFLLCLLLAVTTITVFTCRGDQPWARSFRLYLWLGLVVLVVRVLFRVLVGGNDAGHVLLSLPEIPLPDWAAGINLLGPFSREELLAAVYEGLRLATLLIAVGAGNALANPKRLMKSLPPALYEIGTAMVVAISVIPQLADSARRVRAAQQLRGGEPGRGRRMRSVRRLLVPILEDAFERSLSLAAGMDARGYGRSGTATAGQRRGTGAVMILGLIGICVGVYAFLDSTAPRVLAWPMLALGTAAAFAGFVLAGRRVQRSRYRPQRWRSAEVLVALSGGVVGAGLWLVQRADPMVAHPGVLAVPELSPGAVVAVLVGIAPVFVAPPPLTAQNRAPVLPEPVDEPARVVV